MDEINGIGSIPKKPTVVRVKRKRDDAPIESVWLEVASRPTKRLELSKLSLDDATTPPADEAPTKFLFRRVETLNSRVEDLFLPNLLSKVNSRKRARESQALGQARLTKNDQGQFLSAAKEQHDDVSSKTAYFEQVCRSRRRGRKVSDNDDAIRELFNLYDVVRVDTDMESAAKAERRKQAKMEAELTEGQLLCNYLPLLREFLPSVADEIDAVATTAAATTPKEDYVYDLYALDEDDDSKGSEAAYPIIQIRDDDDDWQGLNEEDYDSDDSNDENNPNNDYPEEEDDLTDDDLHGDSNSDSSLDINPYGSDDEEYDTILSDEEKIWRPRK